jgi:hypothetical protein
MVEDRFIFEVTNVERIRLGLTEECFLYKIGICGSESAYGIFKSLKKTKSLKPRVSVELEFPVSSMAYKNVHKRVKRLESLGLIEKVPAKQFIHRAIKYRLTTSGIFQCLQNPIISAIHVVTDKDKRYKENIIVQTILYQFFEPQTIKEFDFEPRLIFLGRYLQVCSRAILSKIEEFRSSRFKDKKKRLAEDLDAIINDEIKKFVFEIVTALRTKELIITRLDSYYKKHTMREIDLALNSDLKHKTLYPMSALARDKKFIKLVKKIKMDFDNAYKDFTNLTST